MHVLHVFKTYFPETQGGLEEVIRQICRSTQRLGVKSRVLTLSSDVTPRYLRRQEALVVRCHRTADVASCGLSLDAWRVFRRQLRWADVIHYHYPWPFADLLHLIARVSAPAVLTYHADIVRQQRLMRFYAPLMQRFFASLDRVVATSSNYAASSEVLRRYRHKVEVIPIGLDEAGYPIVEDDRLRALRSRVGEGFFFFVGVLRYYKGLDVLLDAVEGTKLPVVIAGSGPIGADLRAEARRRGIDNVHFLGQVSDMDKVALFRLARAVVFPSYMRAEAFGVTLAEGAMYSKPLISTEIGTGTSYVNVNGETGIVIPPKDTGALRDAMQALHRDGALAQRLGANARRRYEQLFTAERMGAAYAALYRCLAT
ncbi:MAG TPA: glycosyltransferase [Nitrococcus sp.]|nr:glycosyltransferase [Nitrococcus sp.]